MKTIIIDDEPIALEKLRKYVEKDPVLELVGACTNGIEAKEYVTSNNIDLIITDINMPDINGMEFVGTLPNSPLVIFITAYAEYAVDSYKLNAVDYLLKPYSFADFQRAINRASERFESRRLKSGNGDDNSTENNDTPEIPLGVLLERGDFDAVFIKTDYKYIRVNLKDIIYIKGFGEYLQVYVKDMEHPMLTLSSFPAVMQLLPEQFVQVHRSYIVNLRYIKSIERSRVFISPEIIIPIGDSYRKDFFDYLRANSIGRSTRMEKD